MGTIKKQLHIARHVFSPFQEVIGFAQLAATQHMPRRCNPKQTSYQPSRGGTVGEDALCNCLSDAPIARKRMIQAPSPTHQEAVGWVGEKLGLWLSQVCGRYVAKSFFFVVNGLLGSSSKSLRN